MAPTRSSLLRLALLGAASVACSPDEVVVGDWPCAVDTDVSGTPAAKDVPDVTGPVAAPWTAGFENGFCDYGRVGGFCYDDADGTSSFELVRSPVRSGNFAAAFNLVTEGSAQVRCVRQGVLPPAAYYGAWYYVPAFASNAGNWNLFHFQGGSGPSELLEGLWDVSLRSTPQGELFLQVFDFFAGTFRVIEGSPPIPIGAWFHVEMYLQRAADATGRIEIYQDGQLVFTLADLVTDDTAWGQWYVGNLADALTPAESTVYVDDVTIRITR